MGVVLPDDIASALVGAHGEVTHVVSDAMTAIAAGSGDLPVLATPTMIAFLEAAACQALGHLLPSGLTSVGSHVDVRHLVPSPVGARVVAEARVVRVEGAKVTFDVTATHHIGHRTAEIGSGTHTRVIVERGGFLNSL